MLKSSLISTNEIVSFLQNNVPKEHEWDNLDLFYKNLVKTIQQEKSLSENQHLISNIQIIDLIYAGSLFLNKPDIVENILFFTNYLKNNNLIQLEPDSTVLLYLNREWANSYNSMKQQKGSLKIKFDSFTFVTEGIYFQSAFTYLKDLFNKNIFTLQSFSIEDTNFNNEHLSIPSCFEEMSAVEDILLLRFDSNTILLSEDNTNHKQHPIYTLNIHELYERIDSLASIIPTNHQLFFEKVNDFLNPYLCEMKLFRLANTLNQKEKTDDIFSNINTNDLLI